MPVIVLFIIICVAVGAFYVFNKMFDRIPFEVHRKMNENREAIVTSADVIIQLLEAVPFESWTRSKAFPESLFAQPQTSIHAGLFEVEGKYYAAKTQRDFNRVNAFVADLHSRVTDNEI